MFDSLAFEEKQIQLRLEEIHLQRRLNEIQFEKQEIQSWKKKKEPVNVESVEHTPYLHYSKSAMEGIPRIANVCPDGSIKIYGKNDSEMISKKYSMKSLLWIRGNLHKWSDKQKETTGFFKILAAKYSKRFVKISHITMESLCYIVDSGKADVWFRKYDELKNGKQSTLKI